MHQEVIISRIESQQVGTFLADMQMINIMTWHYLRSVESVRPEKNHWDDESGEFGSVSNQPPMLFWLHCEKMFGSLDKRDVVNTSSRFRTPSSDKQQGRPLHHPGRTCSDNFITIHYLNTVSTCTTVPCVGPYHCKAPCWRTFAIAESITCATNGTRSPSEVMSQSTG